MIKSKHLSWDLHNRFCRIPCEKQKDKDSKLIRMNDTVLQALNVKVVGYQSTIVHSKE